MPTQEPGKQEARSQPAGQEQSPPPVNTAVSSGHPIDNAGGAGLGKPPGEADVPAVSQPAEKKAVDLQDRRDGSA
jgi:hypothetical protein